MEKELNTLYFLLEKNNEKIYEISDKWKKLDAIKKSRELLNKIEKLII